MEELRELKSRMEQERPAQWEELPDLALYMDQIISYMSRQLIHFDQGEGLTSAMVNNYIKDGLVPRADGKRYGPVHLGYLTAVCALKKVLSVRDMGILIAAADGQGQRDAVSLLLCRPGPGPDGHRPDHRRRCPAGRPGPDGPGPGPAQLCRPAGLRPHSGHSPARAAGAGPQEQKMTGAFAPPPMERSASINVPSL